MEAQPCVFLGIKVKPGPIQRHKIENFGLDNTVTNLRTEAEKKSDVPSASLELIHHGKILKDGVTLQESGIKCGEMIHVVKKKTQAPAIAPQTYSDADLQQIVCAMRSFGCTPNAPGWTRAMQILNDETSMSEIIEAVPALGEDCVTVSILHEVELLAALAASVQTMRRGSDARPDLPAALRHLIRLVRSKSSSSTTSTDPAPTSGFAYSLEALSEDEDVDDEDNEDGQRNTITQEQLAAALQAATEAVSGGGRGAGGLLRLGESRSTDNTTTNTGYSSRSIITSQMIRDAITEANNRTRAAMNQNSPGSDTSLSGVTSDTEGGTPMEQSAAASSSQSPSSSAGYLEQLQRMREMGLVDDALNLRALLICSGNVNDAINLVFSGAIGDLS